MLLLPLLSLPPMAHASIVFRQAKKVASIFRGSLNWSTRLFSVNMYARIFSACRFYFGNDCLTAVRYYTLFSLFTFLFFLPPLGSRWYTLHIYKPYIYEFILSRCTLLLISIMCLLGVVCLRVRVCVFQTFVGFTWLFINLFAFQPIWRLHAHARTRTHAYGFVKCTSAFSCMCSFNVQRT